MTRDFNYLLIKYDLEFRVVYVNGAFCQLTGIPQSHFNGYRFDGDIHFEAPDAILKHYLNMLDSQGYMNGFVKLNYGGQSLWLFTDLGTRFDHTGKQLSYESILYPPNPVGVEETRQLYKKLFELEKRNEMLAAQQQLQDYFNSKTPCYEAYVHQIQRED